MTATQSAPVERSRSACDAMRKHLIFSLGDQEFGIDVLHIKEIIQMQEITAVPKTPASIRGVINLRGQVIPVLDLSVKLNVPEQQVTAHTCIVVVRLQHPAGERLVGAIADGVSEVLTIADEDVEQSPDFGSGQPLPHLRGLAKVRGKVKMLLNVDKVFSGAGMLQ
jgi:purine-binding chemotaxis protein CheW